MRLLYRGLYRWRKRRFFKQKVNNIEKMIWDKQFKRRYLAELREGKQTQYGEIMEKKVDPAYRRLLHEKYKVYYTEGGNEVDIKTLPVPFKDIEQLPDKPTKDIRYYKVAKGDPDKTICENLQKLIDRFTPDLEQLKQQMQGIKLEMDGPLRDEQGTDRSVSGDLVRLQANRELLIDYLKTL